MKVLPFKIPKPEQNAIVFQIDHDEIFYDKLHQHEEIQLSLIVEGEGTLIVGDTINHYSKDDILVIGSNLPHVFKSDVNASKVSHMLTLFFTKSSFVKSAAAAIGAAARYVEIPSVGHGTLRQSPCARQIIADFIVDPAATLDTSCVTNEPPINFMVEGD